MIGEPTNPFARRGGKIWIRIFPIFVLAILFSNYFFELPPACMIFNHFSPHVFAFGNQ
jgi:hypothetical protein